MDLFNTRNPQQQEQVITSHVAALRRKRYLVDVPLIIVPENQLGYFHQRIEERFRSVPNCHILFQNGGSKPGIAKTKELTADYVHRARTAFDEGNIMFESHWVTVAGQIHGSGAKIRDRKGLQEEMCKQLMRFGYDEKMRLTGKYGAHQDDGAIAFMMFLYWAAAVERPFEGNPYLVQFPFLRR